jgi:hypothetical protein
MTRNKKTKAYIAPELKVFIEEVGPNTVTQICKDNAPNMFGAMDDMRSSNVLDLMLED